MVDRRGKPVSWKPNTVGFLIGIYQDINTGEKLLGFQKCAYLAEFPHLRPDGDYLRYTDNQLSDWTKQTQVRMLYGFRITKIK